MSLETSKKVLKVFGIILIIFAVLGLLAGIAALAGGGLLAGAVAGDASAGDAAIVGGVVGIIGVVIIIAGVVDLLEGIFCVRGAKDSSKIMPAWVFTIIGLILSVISVFTNLKGGTSTIVSGVVQIVIQGLAFWSANTIKNSR